MIVLLGLVVGFLCGSIPFGLIIARAKGIDLRAHGSGNIGATNVGRVLGFKGFLVCFLFDMSKGFVPTLGFGMISGFLGVLDIPTLGALSYMLVAAAPILGHMFSPFAGFKGGKGVATAVGALLAVFPAMTLPAVGGIFVFILVLALWRFVSAASCAAAASIPLWTWFQFSVAERQGHVADWLGAGWPFFAFGIALAALVIWRHRTNLGRLLKGTEPRIGRTRTP
jgi:glycerol-3-phosphate acyltransferase PlsY